MSRAFDQYIGGATHPELVLCLIAALSEAEVAQKHCTKLDG
jgi:hypothetical protein